MLLDPSLTFQMWNLRPSLVSSFDASLPNYAIKIGIWNEGQGSYSLPGALWRLPYLGPREAYSID
jgi:hypothetical protein